MDDELVRRAARGDTEAFDVLVRDRIDRLFAIAVRILRDHYDAEDAVQHALWTAWTDLPGLRQADRFDAVFDNQMMIFRRERILHSMF